MHIDGFGWKKCVLRHVYHYYIAIYLCLLMRTTLYQQACASPALGDKEMLLPHWYHVETKDLCVSNSRENFCAPSTVGGLDGKRAFYHAYTMFNME